MLMNRAKSLLSVVLLGGAATLGSIGSAQAAIYTGNWDPAYGGIFPELGWKASAIFDVPDACAAIGTGSNIPTSAAPAPASTSSAPRSSSTTSPIPGTILASFNLNPNVNVTGIDIAGGKLSRRRHQLLRLLRADAGHRRRRRLFVQPDPVLRRHPGAADLCQSDNGRRPPARTPRRSSPVPICGHSANAAIGMFAPRPRARDLSP